MRTRLPAAVAVTLALPALVLAGCSVPAGSAAGAVSAPATAVDYPGTVPTLAPDQKVSIVFESYNLLQAGVWSDTINGLVADFEAAHPNITVKAQPTQGASTAGTNTVGSVQTQLLAGNPPDVAQITFDGLDYTVNELGAQSVEKLFGTKAVQAAFGGEHPFHPRAATLADWDGVTYGMPYVFSTPVLFYNKTALAKAGITDPDLSTWDSVEKVAKQLSAASGKPSLAVSCAVTGGNWCMQGVIRSAGGDVLSADRKTIEFGQAGAVSAVQKMRDLYDAGVLANLSSTDQYEAFERGDVALELQTSALQGAFMAAAKTGGWELADTTMPAFTGHSVVPTNSGSALFMFSKDPAKQAAAWEFMTFMTSDHAYEQISTKIGYLPLRTSLTDAGQPLADWAAGNPLVAPNLKQLDALQPWQSYPGKNYVQVDDLLAKAIENSVFYGKDPATELGDAATRAQALIQG